MFKYSKMEITAVRKHFSLPPDLSGWSADRSPAIPLIWACLDSWLPAVRRLCLRMTIPVSNCGNHIIAHAC